MSNAAFVSGESELCLVDGTDREVSSDAFVKPDYLGREAVWNIRKPIEIIETLQYEKGIIMSVEVMSCGIKVTRYMLCKRPPRRTGVIRGHSGGRPDRRHDTMT